MSEKIIVGDEVHYAPVAGYLAVFRVDDFVKGSSWEDQHALMREFLEKREGGKLSLVRRQKYGHPFFHRHRGLVDVYVYTCKSARDDGG